MAMNEQKEIFAKAKLRGFSNREAALLAGYSAKTASASGSRLAKDEDVLAEIARLKQMGYEPPPEEPEEEVAATQPDGAAEQLESLDRIALSARQRAIVRGTTVELDGVLYDQTDPKDQLTLCQLGVIFLNRQQIESAKSLLPYYHGKVADMGKKDAANQAAQNVVGGKYSPMAQPISPQGKLWQ